MRLLPSPGCQSVYEDWDTALDVGGVLRGRPGFAIDNAITQFDPAHPEQLIFNKGSACGPDDPAGWRSLCKGDRRTVFHPRWIVRNRGRSRFRTDAFGHRARDGLLQVVTRRLRVDQGEECCGVENAFVMERPSDGGIYRAGHGFHSDNFEYPGTACSPNDGWQPGQAPPAPARGGGPGAGGGGPGLGEVLAPASEARRITPLALPPRRAAAPLVSS